MVRRNPVKFVCRVTASFLALLVLLLPSVALIVHAHPEYRASIPNGNGVMRNGVAWPSVGHDNPTAGGTLNVFGEAYSREGNAWTRALCEEDSDGDGYSNGMELGDPDCTWTDGSRPDRLVTISHPGYSDSTPETANNAPRATDDPSSSDSGAVTRKDTGGAETLTTATLISIIVVVGAVVAAVVSGVVYSVMRSKPEAAKPPAAQAAAAVASARASPEDPSQAASPMDDDPPMFDFPVEMAEVSAREGERPPPPTTSNRTSSYANV